MVKQFLTKMLSSKPLLLFVEKHREKGLKGEEEMEDFVDVLISPAEKNGEAIPDKDAFVKTTAIVMFTAGSDTSSICLEWALSLLLSHPHAMNMAQEELDYEVGRNRLVAYTKSFSMALCFKQATVDTSANIDYTISGSIITVGHGDFVYFSSYRFYNPRFQVIKWVSICDCSTYSPTKLQEKCRCMQKWHISIDYIDGIRGRQKLVPFFAYGPHSQDKSTGELSYDN